MLSLLAKTIEITNPLNPKIDTIGKLINVVATYFVNISAAVATLAILYGAFLLLSSGGNTEQVTKARNTIFYACLGFVVALVSVGLVNLVIDILGGATK